MKKLEFIELVCPIENIFDLVYRPNDVPKPSRPFTEEEIDNFKNILSAFKMVSDTANRTLNEITMWQ